MPRNVTVTFSDGTTHTYQNVPDEVTPDDIEARAQTDYPGLQATEIKGEAADGTASSEVAPTKLPMDIEAQFVAMMNDPRIASKDIAQFVFDNGGFVVDPAEIDRNRETARQTGQQITMKYSDTPGEISTETPPPDESAGQWLGVLNRALAPYATAAGLGAAAGAPFAGVGAPIGAAGGVVSLGLTDLGTGLYNLATPLWGGKRVPLPSETIQNAFVGAGLARNPQTAGQRIIGDTAAGAASGLSGAGAFQALAPRAATPLARNVMAVMGEQPFAQAAAGAGAAALPSAAREAGIATDPLSQFALSMAGGMAGGRLGTAKPKQVTGEQLRAQANSAYQAAEDAGVQFTPASVAGLGADIEKSLTSHPKVQYNAKLHPRIAVALDEIAKTAKTADDTGQPVSFSNLELLRRVARTAGRSTDADERRLGSQIIRKIDDFVDAPPKGSILAGDAPGAAQSIKDARSAWRRMSQADMLETAVEKASNSARGLDASSLRSQFRTIANNPNRLRTFDKDIQAQIKGLAKGSKGLSMVQGIGGLSPDMTNPLGILKTIGTGAVGYAHPAIGASMAIGGLAGKTAANRMALSRVQNMISQARGTPATKMPAGAAAMTSARQSIQNAMAPNVLLSNEAPSLEAPPGQRLIGYGKNPNGEMYPIYGY